MDTDTMSSITGSRQPTVDQYRAELCRRDFYYFVQTFWDVVCSEDPVWNWHIRYICNELQVLAERVFDRLPKLYDLIINVPPGSTKSNHLLADVPLLVLDQGSDIQDDFRQLL